MIIALLSDIHGNLEALNACLKDAGECGATRYAFLGDFVGYGADPQKVVDIIARHAAEGAVINGGEKAPTIEVRGYAWSGAGRIAKVEIMAGPAGASAAETWREATLGEQASPYSWREFSLRTLVAFDNGGPEMDVGLMARATDEAGNAQPLGARWNALGYANNAVHPVRIRIRA